VSERLACAYLRRCGYEIEATNVRYRVGELDIVARDGNTLCFIEVRSASSRQFGPPAASITDRKQQHLIRAVRHYLHRRRVRWLGDMRFDVVAIQHHRGKPPSIELIRGAFEAWPRGGGFGLHPVEIVFGDPIDPRPYRNSRDPYSALTEKLRNDVKILSGDV